MRAAILDRLRVLVACLVLAVVARPLVAELAAPRAVAELVAAVSVRPADVARPRAPARAPRAAAPLVVSVAPGVSPSDVASLPPLATERTPHRGTSPLYLTQARFLL